MIISDHRIFLGTAGNGGTFKTKMSDIDTSALQYVFPAELLRHFSIIQSGIKTDKPTGEDYLEVVFEEKNELPDGYSEDLP